MVWGETEEQQTHVWEWEWINESINNRIALSLQSDNKLSRSAKKLSKQHRLSKMMKFSQEQTNEYLIIWIYYGSSRIRSYFGGGRRSRWRNGYLNEMRRSVCNNNFKFLSLSWRQLWYESEAKKIIKMNFWKTSFLSKYSHDSNHVCNA